MLKDEYLIKKDELDQTVDYGEVSEIVYSEMKKKIKAYRKCLRKNCK